MNEYQKMICLAAEHIRQAQRADGGFDSFSSVREDDFSDAKLRSTTFFPSNIILCIQNSGLDTEVAKEIENRAVEFLLTQRSGQWTFNYWKRDGNDSISSSYPDDLDDTFAALAAITQHNPGMIDGEILAIITKVLASLEAKLGGPYRTWLIGNDMPSAWRDVDVAVNSTIGYFLSLNGIWIPNIQNFIGSAISKKDALLSPYYPGLFQTAYFISRYYKKNSGASLQDQKEKLFCLITDELNRRGQNTPPLEIAMAISSMANLDLGTRATAPINELRKRLLGQLRQNGFKPYAFCIDPAIKGQRAYAGSSALTAAFCLEALSKEPFLIPNPSRATESTANNSIHERICSLALSACNTIGGELRKTATAQIIKSRDRNITALPYEFQEILSKKGRVFSPEIIERLALANLYGWIAYRIYDDALDGEADPLLIPCANFFLRALSKIYGGLGNNNPKIGDLFDSTINRIDEANTWEQVNCNNPRRPPDFGDHANLADRSIGHAMGPLVLLLLGGCTADSNEYQNILWFFRHYLIARQLHDDAHDWIHDLSRGRVNSVGALTLQRYYKRFPNDDRPIPLFLPELQKLFWEETIDEISSIICSHILSARHAREGSRLLAGTAFMENGLFRFESSAKKAISERNQTIKFLKYYNAPRPSGKN